MQLNSLINYVNATLSKEAAKAFKADVMSVCGWNKHKYYRVLNNPSLASKLEREAIAKLANVEVNQIFDQVNP